MKSLILFLLFILPSSLLAEEFISATISGEVKKPGVYSLQKGSKLYDLIVLAGGYTDNAHLRGAVFKRKKGNLNLEEIKRDLSVKFCNFKYELLDIDDKIRIPIELKHPRLLKNSKFDLMLMDGDELYIPVIPDTVSVIGEVLKPGQFPYDKKLDVNDYISMAGLKYTNKKSFVYVYKSNGEVMIPNKSIIFWNELENRWEFSIFSKIS